MAEPLPIDQKVIDNNKEIYARFVSELRSAEFEILAAVAWFTDEELFNILLDKLTEGVRVDIVIADNAENEKLDFSRLIYKGASVIKIKNVGYGIMHQKFCVIDKRRALHGSYNWSVNARNNNHESIIVTDHKETVESLIRNFNNIKERAKSILAGEDVNSVKDFSSPPLNNTTVEEKQTVKSDYERVLDSMIAAEVSSFNREALRNQGYERSKSNNGDHQVLNKALDTLYNGFINDIDVIEDKKRRLLTKIDEQKAKAESLLKEKCSLQLETIQQEAEITQNNLSNKVIALKSEILINQAAISDIKENKIPALKARITAIEEVIKECMLAFVKPGIKWFEIIWTSVLAIGLFVYLLMFYSSAAYILLYSEQDAIIAQKTSSDPLTPQVFDPDALSKAYEHGGMAVLFVALFVLVPVTFALLSKIMTNKRVANILTYSIGVVVVDTFIAIKVAKAIHEIKNLTEINPKPWQLTDVFYDINFYLVFIMGAFGVILFKFCFEKISEFFDARNPDVARERNKLFIAQKKDEIKDLENEITQELAEVQRREEENILKNSQIVTSENELAGLPLKKASQLENRKNDLNNKLQVIQTTTDIYKSHIENDNIPVSIDALKDRINVFLEGWNDFLHNEYSISKASSKSASATEVALNWEHEKLNRNSIDSRVKIK